VLALRHETPELLWQASHLHHPNGAVALREVVVVVQDLDDAVVRYTRLFGVNPQRRPGTACYTLAAGAFVLCSADAGAAFRPPALPFPARITIAVKTTDAAAALLQAHGVPYARVGPRLRVDAAWAAGVQILFEPELG